LVVLRRDIRFWFAVAMSLMLCSACVSENFEAAERNPGTVKIADTLGKFCAKLPRLAYAELARHTVSNDWFEVYQIDSGVWAIYEPHQWQEVISYLIVGTHSAVLFDTGNGLGNIKEVIDQLTDKPVTVINSHAHIDHIGGNFQFDQIASISTDFSIDRSLGVDDVMVKEEASSAALCRPLPAGVTMESHKINPYKITKKIEDGSQLDLGGRKLEVLHIPGHTDDSVALLDRAAGFLWTGDSFYQGPIWLFADETDLRAYHDSIKTLAALTPDLTLLLPAHNTPAVKPTILKDVLAAFEQVISGRAKAIPEWDGVIRFQFEGFSFLLRENFQPATLL